MKVLVHAMVPLYIEVDTETDTITRAVIDIEDFKYEDPPYTTNLEGGPVPSHEADAAYNIASDNEGEWMPIASLTTL